MTYNQKKLKNIISEFYTLQNSDEITFDSKLKDLFDSLDLIQLRTAIEEEFNISLQEQDLNNSKTIKDMLNIIELRTKERENKKYF